MSSKRMARFRPTNLKLVKFTDDIAPPPPVDEVQDFVGDKEHDKNVKLPYAYRINDSGSFEFDQIKVRVNGIILGGGSDHSPITQTPASQSDPEFTPSENVTLDDFETIKKLGEGAQASVDKVRNRKTKQIFARKRFILDASENASGKMLITEFQSLYASDCKNIIRMYHAFYREKTMHMIIEFMNCGSLLDLIRTCGPIPEQTLAKLSIQILNGLVYLHEVKGIVHRDIKPANILVNDHGYAKIADFAMAGRLSTVFSTYQGTGLYMSPERIRAEEHTFDSDIWSLGLTLAECALGTFPFSPQDYQLLMFRRDSGDLTVEQLKSETYSPEFQSFISSCLRVNPKERPSAKSLISSPFIKKYVGTKPSLRRWIIENFVAAKKKQQRRSSRSREK